MAQQSTEAARSLIWPQALFNPLSRLSNDTFSLTLIECSFVIKLICLLDGTLLHFLL